MKRTIEQYRKCNPQAMAHEQSDNAKQFAFEDMRADILELHRELMRFKNIARAIAYPQKGTLEEGYSLMDFAKLLQSAYNADQLWVEPKDR